MAYATLLIHSVPPPMPLENFVPDAHVTAVPEVLTVPSPPAGYSRGRTSRTTGSRAGVDCAAHVLKKDDLTGSDRIISWNSSSLTSMGSPIAGNSALHAPHFPTSARCLAGIRLGLPQEGQFRITC